MLTALCALCALACPALADGWKAGAAVQAITPKEPMWMAGYASRTKPAEGKEQELYVKALAIEDPAGTRVVLLSSDLIGITRPLAEAVRARVHKQLGLKREALMLTSSHTHSGPVIRDNLADMYPMSAAEAKKIAPYTRQLEGWMVDVIAQAVKNLAPAALSVGTGTARFAMNRRQATDKGVIIGSNPTGPVDHSVPVLDVRDAKGKLIAVAFGYACHNTTMDFNRWCGDYAGYAQEELEKKHKGAVALFWSGCGGDANPMPRRKLELCRKYGKELADAVDGVIKGKRTEVTGKLAARYEEVALPFDKLPTREALAGDAKSKNQALRKRAERLLKVLDEGKKIDDHYRHYPVQAWRLGDQVTWVALGGEVVVDYALRLKKELKGPRQVWVTAYANDVMAYVASRRVLKEGGYEADSSMIYYGMPTRWAAGVEDAIVDKARAVVKEVTK